MDEFKAPQIENLQKITSEQAAEYVRFVAQLRHQQRRYFMFRKPEILIATPTGCTIMPVDAVVELSDSD